MIAITILRWLLVVPIALAAGALALLVLLFVVLLGLLLGKQTPVGLSLSLSQLGEVLANIVRVTANISTLNELIVVYIVGGFCLFGAGVAAGCVGTWIAPLRSKLVAGAMAIPCGLLSIFSTIHAVQAWQWHWHVALIWLAFGVGSLGGYGLVSDD